MSATETARSAAQVARSAAQHARDEAENLRRAEKAVRLARQEAINRTARELLTHSPLKRWFPDTTWQFADVPNAEGTYFHQYVVTPADEPGSFYLRLGRRDIEDPQSTVTVSWATRRHDEGYTSWQTHEVKSVAEIGELLLQQDERKR